MTLVTTFVTTFVTTLVRMLAGRVAKTLVVVTFRVRDVRAV